MERRTFIAALGGAAAWRLVTRGQQPLGMHANSTNSIRGVQLGA
jgi:hypothetical protein